MANEPTYDSELWDALREWWQRYGLSVVVLGSVAAIAIGAWQWRERSHLASAQEASDDYALLMEQVAEWDANAEQTDDAERATQLQRITEAADTLRDNYPDSYYAHYAQLLKVRFLVQGGELSVALALLDTLSLQVAQDSDLQELLIMRRARLLEALGRFKEAEQLLQSSPQTIYPQEHQALLGDILRRQGRYEESMRAYTGAVRLYQAAERGDDIPVSLRLHMEALSSLIAALPPSSTGTSAIDFTAIPLTPE